MPTEVGAPQATRLRIRVGILGDGEHRLKELERDPERLRAAIQRVLELVKEVAVRATGGAEQAAWPDLSLLSALEEGADRLWKKEAKEAGFTHERIAPFSGEESYVTPGQALLEQSDLLIAFWAGAPYGGAGETGDVVRKAVKMGVPTLWVDARSHGFHLLERGADLLRETDLSEDLANLLRLRLPFTSNPPRVQLVLRVGVACLGPVELQSSVVNDKIREVLVRIQKILHDVRSEPGCLYAFESPELRLLSTLVEESDREVARVAKALGYKLQFILPCRREKLLSEEEHYKEFLGEKEKVLELDGSAEEKQEVEGLLLLQSDLLIVVSEEEKTVDRIVTGALQLEIPTVRVVVKPTCSAALLAPGERPDALVVSELKELDERLMRMLNSPDSPGKTTERERMRRYFDELRPGWNSEWPFLAFRHFWSGRWNKLVKLIIPGFPFKEDAPQNVRRKYLNDQAVKEGYRAHYEWADSLAKYYAGLYRSSFLLAYFFGAMAVLVAFFGIDEGKMPKPTPASKYWFSAELVFIVFILIVTITGRWKHWHERWMDCRHLAESLRQMQVLALIGSVPASVKVPAHLEPSDPRRSWFNWYFRALVRQAGLIKARLDRDYLSEFCTLLSAEIEGQAEYHRETYKSLKRIHKNLHFLTQFIFGLAAVACFLHVGALLNWFPAICSSESCESRFKFCAIVLPALGAAVGAIHHIGEFERLALRSQSLAGRLKKLEDEVATPTSELQKLSQIANDFSVIMMSELVDWRFVFLDKNLDLPA